MFELMSRSRVGVGDPKQVDAESPEAAGPARPEEGQNETKKQTVEVPKAPQPGATRTPEPKRPKPAAAFSPGPSEPILQTGDGRLRISLNYVSSLVLVGGLLLLLAGAFVLGRKTASNGPGQPLAAGTDPVPALVRFPDKHYLVMARLGGAEEYRDQAEELVAFFRQRDLQADIANLPDGTLLIWSFRPFDDPNSAAAASFVEQVRRIGNSYQNNARPVTFIPEGPNNQTPWFAPKPSN